MICKIALLVAARGAKPVKSPRGLEIVRREGIV